MFPADVLALLEKFCAMELYLSFPSSIWDPWDIPAGTASDNPASPPVCTGQPEPCLPTARELEKASQESGKSAHAGCREETLSFQTAGL